jgi:MoaA/NifB/PqqE/SkfB family radical SAM enzyme
MNCDKKKMNGLNINSKILNGIRPAALSVDINNLCNLRCKHCFWEANYNDKTDMNLNILDSVKQVLNRFPSITNILWYGGEPLINKESVKLLKQGVKLIKNNLIITNGTFPLPSFDAFYHYSVSIDGTQDMHNYLRGANVYEVIKENVIDAIKRKMPVSILYCINALNIDAIPAFLEEWNNKGLIGIVFTVYTAIQGKDPKLTLNDKDMERIAHLLKDIKKKYGKLIVNTDLMIDLIRPSYSKDMGDNCPMDMLNKKQENILSLHLCNNGEIRSPCALGSACALGKKNGHDNCRSVTKLALYAGKLLKDKASFYALVRMYLSSYYYKKNKIRKILNIGDNYEKLN